MPRIRQIKPEFFRHEELQKLGPIPMLVFAGLWCQCDKAGNFPWKPNQLKLDILPFIDFDFGSTMETLWKSGEVIRYSGEDGKEYGHIPSFCRHQRFFGTEVVSKPRFPAYLDGRKHHGSTMEAPWKPLGSLLDRGLGVSGLRVKGSEHSQNPQNLNTEPEISTPIPASDFQEWKAAITEAFKLTPTSHEDELKIYRAYEGFRGKGGIPDMKKMALRAWALWEPHMVTPKAVLNQWDSLKVSKRPKPKVEA
jgi:hypothetical protein